MRLYPAPEGPEQRFTLYLAGAPATLTDVLPLLQQLGVDVLDERPSRVRPARRAALLALRLRAAPRRGHPGRARGPHRGRRRAGGFCSAFSAAWRGDAETDRFSALVLRAGLPWREVAVLRAYARYARQLGSPFGPAYVADTLLAQPGRGARR